MDLYKIKAECAGETVYWRGDCRWTKNRDEGINVGGYNVAVPIAGVLGIVLKREGYSMVFPDHVRESTPSNNVGRLSPQQINDALNVYRSYVNRDVRGAVYDALIGKGWAEDDADLVT